MKYTLTHKGWFGICPVYYANLHSEAPLVIERHWIFAPLHDFSLFTYNCIGWIADLMESGYDMPYPLRVTGEIEPVEIEFS